MNRRLGSIPAVILLAVMATSCSILPTPAPLPAEYRLAPSVDAVQYRPGGPVLLIQTGQAAGGFQTPAMRYSPDGVRLLSYPDGRWAAPPQAMVAEAAAAALRGSGLFSAVVPDTEAVPSHMRLSLQLLELLHDRGQAAVILRLRSVLMDRDGRVLMADVFTAREPSVGTGPRAMATGAMAALERVMGALVERVEQRATDVSPAPRSES